MKFYMAFSLENSNSSILWGARDFTTGNLWNP